MPNPNITEADLAQIAVPQSVLVQILNELKLQTQILMEMHGMADNAGELRKDINLLSE